MRISWAFGLGGIALVSATVAFGSAVLNRLVDGVIFQPVRGAEFDPGLLGLDADEIFLESEAGVRIHAFYLHSAEPGRVLLFLHGNAGNASHRLPNAAEFARLGTDVLLLEYRGYGRSDGTPSEPGVYADARAALAYLVGARGFAPERVVVFGRSLGGAVAVDLAQDRELGGLILESTFTSLSDLGRRLLGPVGALLGRGRFDSARKIPALRAPVLFLHGDRDRTVPIELGQRLFDAAPEPKEFEVILGAGHNDTTLVGGRDYFARIGAFLDRVSVR